VSDFFALHGPHHLTRLAIDNTGGHLLALALNLLKNGKINPGEELSHMKTSKTWVAAAAMVALTGTAQAALVSLGDGTVKDTNTNLIWLQDWNDNGAADWFTQQAWAEGLDFASSTDWRLPEIGEYGALFTAYGDLTKVAEFTNVQSALYWSGTDASTPPGSAWLVVGPTNGGVLAGFQNGEFHAVAVRAGDVVAVSEPQTLALTLMALGAMVAARRRRLL